jgi:hypothetical protein
MVDKDRNRVRRWDCIRRERYSRTNKIPLFVLRIWICNSVLIIDLIEGIKGVNKSRKEFKFIFGVVSN